MTEKQPAWPGHKLNDEHALAVGKIALAWNEFQDNLGGLFATLFGKQRWAYAIAAWNALENDRAQREMLRAVVLLKFGKKHKAYQEIVWLIETANKQLSNWRNFGVQHQVAQAFGERWSRGGSDGFSVTAVDVQNRDEQHPGFDKTSISGGILYTSPALFFGMCEARRNDDAWWLEFLRAKKRWLQDYHDHLKKGLAP